MKALSIRQPWAWLIMNAGKDIENRVWHTSVRGRILVHAAKGMTRDEYESGIDALIMVGVQRVLPALTALERGGIVGSVEIVDCVRQSSSRWHAHGQWGFVLRDPQPLPFRPLKGALGFFDVPDA